MTLVFDRGIQLMLQFLNRMAQHQLSRDPKSTILCCAWAQNAVCSRMVDSGCALLNLTHGKDGCASNSWLLSYCQPKVEDEEEMRTMWGLVSRFKFGALRYLSHRIDVEVIALITQSRDDSRVLRSLRRFKLASSLLIGRRAALVTFNVFEKRVALLFVSDKEKEELISNLIGKISGKNMAAIESTYRMLVRFTFFREAFRLREAMDNYLCHGTFRNDTFLRKKQQRLSLTRQSVSKPSKSPPLNHGSCGVTRKASKAMADNLKRELALTISDAASPRHKIFSQHLAGSSVTAEGAARGPSAVDQGWASDFRAVAFSPDYLDSVTPEQASLEIILPYIDGTPVWDDLSADQMTKMRSFVEISQPLGKLREKGGLRPRRSADGDSIVPIGTLNRVQLIALDLVSLGVDRILVTNTNLYTSRAHVGYRSGYVASQKSFHSHPFYNGFSGHDPLDNFRVLAMLRECELIECDVLLGEILDRGEFSYYSEMDDVWGADNQVPEAFEFGA